MRCDARFRLRLNRAEDHTRRPCRLGFQVESGAQSSALRAAARGHGGLQARSVQALRYRLLHGLEGPPALLRGVSP